MKVQSALLSALLTAATLAEAGPLNRRKFRGKSERGTRNAVHGQPVQPRPVHRRSVNESSCVISETSNAISAPYANLWAGLTDVEAAAVTKFLFQDESLNLTASANSTSWDNTLLLVELMQPNKTDVLPFINGAINGSNATASPARYAHAVLDFRATSEAYVQDFIIGPLPVQNGTTTIEPLNWPYNKGEGWIRNYDADDDPRTDFLYTVGASIADITMDMWGVAMRGLENDTANMWGIEPLWHEDGRVISWDQFWMDTSSFYDSDTLLPLGLYIKTDVTGRNSSEWSVQGVLYNNIFYETLDDFRAAWNSSGFVVNGPNIDGDWARPIKDGPELPMDHIYPPVNVQPEGPRFGVDVENKYVEWMDFSFYMSFSRDTGVALHDIRYKGERVVYELGLQEALAHYAGNDPHQSGTAYLDTYYGFGPYAFELTPGYDCPVYSTFLNTTFYVDETTHTHPNSICIFEQDAGYPIQRHTSQEYTSATKNIFLAVRTVSTVGNYDYLFQYSFYLDGSMAIDVRASGYIQSAYFAANDDYGFKIHDNLSGSMHDHVLNWKVDLDVLGTQNTLMTTEVVPTQETYPWSGGRVHNTMKLKRGEITNEAQGKIDWPDNNNVFYSVVNKDEKNKYGEYRGWRIAPNSGNMIHLTIENSTDLNSAAEWSKHHLFVTKRKDTEPRGTHAYNTLDTANPVVNFGKFFDDEDIEQEDIVLWFNLGMHHVPHTGDLPNTVFTTAHSSVVISPQNYLLENPSKQSQHQMQVKYADGKADVQRYGVTAPTCAMDMSSVEADLSTYHGDVVIRKFPYDPNNWYFETESIT